ncbi:arginase family protein [Cribrihabitans pelagius]|uniref:arginase family protein n=1 Tax=Cribrihabitans pelagius TaxID=1765746 RepID=UPI003B5BC665
MDFNLIVSQGRAADKTARTIKGAALTAAALEETFGVKALSVGEPSPPAEDDWTDSLPQAKPTLEAVRAAVSRSVESGKLTVLASNTCSISLATLPVLAKHHPDAVLLWVDAHGDFNTPDTTDTGYLGGMVVAAACGLWNSGHGAGLKASQVIFTGARDIDPLEAKLIEKAGGQILPAGDFSPEAVLKAVGGRKVWIHIDWDVLEPGHIPADYKVPGGLVPKQLRALLAALPSEQVLGLELAEYQVPADAGEADAALTAIVDTVTPLLDRVEAA